MSDSLAAKKDREESAVIILDNLDFRFYEKQTEEALELWKSGASLPEMVARLRPLDRSLYRSYAEREAEVFMLLMHLSLEGRLPERPGKVWGFETGVI